MKIDDEGMSYVTGTFHLTNNVPSDTDIFPEVNPTGKDWYAEILFDEGLKTLWNIGGNGSTPEEALMELIEEFHFITGGPLAFSIVDDKEKEL